MSENVDATSGAGNVNSIAGADTDGMSLSDKIFFLMMGAAEEQEARVEERFNMIEGKRGDTANYNKIMEQLRVANGKLDPEEPDDTVDVGDLEFVIGETGEEVNVKDYLEDAGFTVDDDEMTKDQITGLMDTVKDRLDGNSSQSQTDIIKLQNENSKLNRIYELLSNFLKKDHDMKSSIIRNI